MRRARSMAGDIPELLFLIYFPYQGDPSKVIHLTEMARQASIETEERAIFVSRKDRACQPDNSPPRNQRVRNARDRRMENVGRTANFAENYGWHLSQLRHPRFSMPNAGGSGEVRVNGVWSGLAGRAFHDDDSGGSSPFGSRLSSFLAFRAQVRFCRAKNGGPPRMSLSVFSRQARAGSGSPFSISSVASST